MQEAFQKGTAAYKAVVNGEMFGREIVVVDKKRNNGYT